MASSFYYEAWYYLKMWSFEFNDKQLDRLSDFCSNLSILVIATLVLPNIFSIGKPSLDNLVSGVILTLLFIISSMVLVKDKEK